MKTNIINVYGGPGVGKSTSAAYFYYLLKAAGANVELVREYVKGWAWEGRPFGAYDEIYFLGKQVRHESMLFGKVDWIVTDAPVYMTAYYASLYCSPKLARGVVEAAQAFYQQAQDDGHNHIHVMLKRNRPYQAEGRYQTEEQALAVDIGVKKLLKEINVSFIETVSSELDLLNTLNSMGGIFLAREPHSGKVIIITNEMKEALSRALVANAEAVADLLYSVAPNGDYSKVIEGGELVQFLKTEAISYSNWEYCGIITTPIKSHPNAMKITFRNKLIQDEEFAGYIVVDATGKILHCFVSNS